MSLAHLPLRYIPKWILISTPIFYLIFFVIGFSFYIKRIFLRLINIKNESLNHDLWKGKKKKFDFFIFFSFFQILAIYLSMSPNLIKVADTFFIFKFLYSFFCNTWDLLSSCFVWKKKSDFY